MRWKDIKTSRLFRKVIRLKRNQIRITNQNIISLLIEYDKLPYIPQNDTEREAKEHIIELRRDLYDELEEYKDDLETYKEDYEKWLIEIKILNSVKR